MDESKGSLYQVTADGLVIAEFPDGYLAGQFAGKVFTARAARGKAISIRRSDGLPPYTA